MEKARGGGAADSRPNPPLPLPGGDSFVPVTGGEPVALFTGGKSFVARTGESSACPSAAKNRFAHSTGLESTCSPPTEVNRAAPLHRRGRGWVSVVVLPPIGKPPTPLPVGLLCAPLVMPAAQNSDELPFPIGLAQIGDTQCRNIRHDCRCSGVRSGRGTCRLAQGTAATISGGFCPCSRNQFTASIHLDHRLSGRC